MSLTIELSPESEARLRERAAAAGKDAVTYAREALEDKIQAPKSFREIFAPMHEAFGENPIPPEELNALFHKLREEVWMEGQSLPPLPAKPL